MKLVNHGCTVIEDFRYIRLLSNRVGGMKHLSWVFSEFKHFDVFVFTIFELSIMQFVFPQYFRDREGGGGGASEALHL